ncbi:MAG: hypothetical protein ACYC4R_14660 [Anaerolineae bacterium]
MKKALPVAAAVLCGLVILIDYFVPDPRLDLLGSRLVEGAMILAAFALLLGILNLLAVHARRIGEGRKGGGYSVILLLALLLTLTIGVLAPASTLSSWVFSNVLYPLQATMGALLAFFLVSAAYRAFRLRSAGAVLLLVTSMVVLFTQLPFARALSPQIPLVRDWILAVPVTAGMRGIILGVALGSIATSLRILLAVDHPYASS